MTATIGEQLALTGMALALIDEIGEPTEGNGQNANNSVGATIRGLKAAGIITATGRYRKASRPTAHARIISEWRVL